MPNKTVPALPSASTLSGTEPVETVQSGASVKTTTQAIANLAPSAAAAVLVESGAAKKVSALTTAGTLSGTETVPVVQSSTTKKTTAQDIANLAPSATPSILVESGISKKISALSAASALAGTETVAIVQGGETVAATVQDIADLATVAGMTIVQSADTNHPLVLADNGTYIQFTSGSAVTVVIPTNLSVAFPVNNTTIIFEQYGAGTVTITATGGVTLHSAGGLVASNGQYATFSLVKVATNTWTLMGNLA